MLSAKLQKKLQQLRNALISSGLGMGHETEQIPILLRTLTEEELWEAYRAAPARVYHMDAEKYMADMDPEDWEPKVSGYYTCDIDTSISFFSHEEDFPPHKTKEEAMAACILCYLLVENDWQRDFDHDETSCEYEDSPTTGITFVR